MSAPIKLSFDVACSAKHAFKVWTAGIDTWWPPDHTLSGKAEKIVLEAGVGGRIYERTFDGAERDWGWVTVWEPSTRLVYAWHIGREASSSTEVEIRFLSEGDALTRIEIEHRGWERLGVEGEEWHAQNQGGWETLLPLYQAAIARGVD